MDLPRRDEREASLWGAATPDGGGRRAHKGCVVSTLRTLARAGNGAGVKQLTVVVERSYDLARPHAENGANASGVFEAPALRRRGGESTGGALQVVFRQVFLGLQQVLDLLQGVGATREITEGNRMYSLDFICLQKQATQDSSKVAEPNLATYPDEQAHLYDRQSEPSTVLPLMTQEVL